MQYHSGGDHARSGGNGRPKITKEERAAFQQVLENNPSVYLPGAERHIGVSKATIQRPFSWEFCVLPHKLSMSNQLRDQDKQARACFAQYCLSVLENDEECLNGFFSDWSHFHCQVVLTSRAANSLEANVLNKYTRYRKVPKRLWSGAPYLKILLLSLDFLLKQCH